MQEYHRLRIAANEQNAEPELQLPEHVQLAIDGLAGKMREGLLALSVGVGMKVMDELIEEELVRLCGPKGKHDAERTASRHGSRRSSVVLGGRKVSARRPRARGDDGELPLRTWELFSSQDLLDERTVEVMLAGLSTRRYRQALEPTGTEDRSTSRSAVSRRFVRKTREALGELMSRPVPEDLVVLMLDGVGVGHEHTCVVALGIDAQGTKHPLGLWEGATENKTVCARALADLQDRGLAADDGLLAVIDGSKALHAAITGAFGERVLIQRCRIHKQRNVLGHLPEDERPWVQRKLREAWALSDAATADRRLRELARALQVKRPGAAASLREGLEETLTITRLGFSIESALARTLRSTNPIESMLSVSRERSRNVKRWRGGEMVLRWTAAGMLDAERSFRRVRGHRELPELQAALRRHTTRPDTEEVTDFPTAA